VRSMRVKLALAVVVAGVLGVGAVALAGGGGNNLETDLNGYEENPALSTPGVGEFEARINRSETEIRYELTFDDLESEAQQAHIHFEKATNNGDVVAFLCTNLGNAPAASDPPACPAAGGTVRGTLDENDVVPTGEGIEAREFDELIAAIRAGVTYVNVHSALRPTGEIRGQIDRHDNRGHGDD
jgi:hypothetical protein